MLLVLWLASLSVAAAATAGTVMPWMCLERCSEDVAADLGQLLQLGKSSVPAVSFEAWDLYDGPSLKWNGFTDVSPMLRSQGFGTWAMITSANITKMRALFATPDRFIAEAITAGQTRGYVGFNIDFEPGPNTTAADAGPYAQFLQTFGEQLAKANLLLSVDVASWSPLWGNFSLLSKVSSVSRFITMDTYCGNFTTFERLFQKAVAAFGVEKVGIGLETVNPNTNVPFSDAEVQERFQMIIDGGIQFVGIWMTPLPANFIPWIQKFVAGVPST